MTILKKEFTASEKHTIYFICWAKLVGQNEQMWQFKEKLKGFENKWYSLHNNRANKGEATSSLSLL